MDESIIQSILNAAIEIDYESLKYLRDTSNLVPGTYYRIIDFVTKTAQPNTRSAEHQFDIIVQAVYSNVLSENAYAVKHAGLSTDYFANSDLSSWKIGYALDNVSSAYGWGDNIGGKGVIYYMKDEFNNECPYDFKNIQFLRQKNTHNIWCYTFSYYYDGPNSTLEVVDTSIKGNDGTLTGENRDNTRNVQNNVIKEFRDYVAGVPTAPAFLNSIVFLSTESYGINYGGCSNNVFGRDCYVNTFGNACNDNKFGERCYLNTFENDCSSNTTENFFIQNGFGNGCCRNTFGNECTQIKFYEGCTDNSFESSCSSITLAENCTDNSFESSCDNIIFEAAYTKNVTVETNNRNITLKALDTSAVTVNYHLEDIIFKENYNNSDTAKTVAANNYYENNTPPENTKIYAPDKIIDVDPNLLLNSPKLSNPNIVRINDNGAVYINGIGSYNGTNEAQAQTLQQVISGITEPMIFKGSVGTDGTVEWADLPSAAAGNKGWMYVVITAHDTTPVCEVGDTIISDGTEWVVIPSGDEPSGTVTSVAATGDTVISISGSPITTSGTLSITHGDSGATAGSYGDSSAQTPGYGDTFKVPYVTVDVKGHVTGISEHTVTIPASDNTDRYVNSAAFADNTTSDANNPIKMTLTRAGSDSATVTANIPKVSSSSAGVVPKGTAVSAQTQTTKFLREDGSWAVPSYTTDTDTTYTLGTDGNNVTLTPSSGSQQSITVPYATNAGTASAIGSSTVGSQSLPVYINSGTPTAINSLSVSGNISSTSGNLSVSGTSTLTGNTTVGGTLSVTGNSTLSGALSVDSTTGGVKEGTISTNIATGTYSHAEGNNTIANNAAEHAEGQYNISNTKTNGTAAENKAGTTQSSIGIGTTDNARANAIEVMQNGDVYVTGVGSYDGTNPNTTGVKTLQTVLSTDMSNAESIAYTSLKTLRDNSGLVPGKWYRITDYTCTTTQTDTQSAGNLFDIILCADDINQLNENAYATHHSGDTYFTNSKVEAWKLKYCIDNDNTRFGWADTTNGKGVIYYMKDEFNNECPYDFKNIQMKFYKITAVTTVPANLNNTYSISKKLGTSTNTITSGCTVDETDFEWRYTFDLFTANSHKDYSLNVYGTNKPKMCVSNSILPVYGEENAFGDNAVSKLQYLNHISFRNTANDSECNYNTFGDKCFNISFGNSCHHNKFGGYAFYDTFASSCYYNQFGDVFYNNLFGNGCMLNVFGNNCFDNSLGTYSYCNSFGNYCENNILGNYCQSTIFEQECYSNTLSDNALGNTFGSGCHHITLAKEYTYSVIIESGNGHIIITSTASTATASKLRNFTITQGVNTSTTDKTISHNTVNDTFQTIYAIDTLGNIKSWVSGDIVKNSGDTMTGYLTLNGAPTQDLHAATKKYVDDAITALPEPMIFKGSVGTGGTVEWANLPSAASGNEGWTYKVITAHDTAPVCEVGDTIISDGSTWVVIPSGDEPSGTVTSVAATGDTVISISGSPITTSGTLSITHGDSGATAGSYGDSSAQTPGYGDTFKVPYVTVNAKGHVTGISEHNVTIPASDNTDRYVNSAAFADNTTSDANNPVKMTLTRAGSDSATVTANIPKISSSSAGVVPKGTAVSAQSQSTKFLREDGTWAAPSYTTDTNTTYTLGTDGNNVTLTPSTGSQQSITVPYATNAETATYIGGSTSTVGSTSLPVYINDGQPSTISSLALTTGNISTTSGTLSVGGTSTLTGNTTVGGTLTVTGDSTLSGTIFADSTTHSVTEGDASHNKASGTYSHAEGYNTNAYGEFSHTEGTSTLTIGESSHAEGCGQDIKIGGDADSTRSAISTGDDISSIRIGDMLYYFVDGEICTCTVTGFNSGISNNTIYVDSIPHLERASFYILYGANGDYSHVEGCNTVASNECSHSEGYMTRATGTDAHAEGSDTIASGNESHAEGIGSIASGGNSHAEGSDTIASGSNSHSEGSNTFAIGDCSHSEGNLDTTRILVNADANATQNITISSPSGISALTVNAGEIIKYTDTNTNVTVYSKITSTSSNRRVTIDTPLSSGALRDANAILIRGAASGLQSHTEGTNTIARNNSEHASGKNNLSNTDTIFSIGIGSSADGRSNAFEIFNNGKVFVNGVGTYDGTNPVTNTNSLQVVLSNLQTQIDNLPNPMVFKGSVGTGGTVEWANLPSAATGNEGWTYKVITAHDTTPVCGVGDTIISDGRTWVVIPSGDEPSGTVTSVAATGDTVISISGSPITTSGTLSITHGDSGATAGSYGDSTAQTPGYGDTFKVPYVTVDVKGHVTGISEHTVTIPASDNTDRYVNSAAFADNTASDANNPVKMTLTRAGSDSATVTANIPKVSSSGAGVVPKGASVSTQSQTTKFLREDGTWAAPSYTTDTNTTYTLGTDGNDVTLTPSSGSQQSITVPYATNAGTASAIGSSTVGSQSVPVYISSGTPTTISYIDTSYLKEPDYDKSTLTSLPLVNTTSGNHFALLPADQIIIEQTTDGGTTWTDAGITDDNKSKLFLGDTSYITSISIPLLDGVRNKQCGLRITFTAMKYDVPEGTPETDKYNYWNSTYATSIERYVTVQSMYIWALAVNDAIRTRVYAAKGSTPTTWEAIDRGNNIYLTGWPNGTFLSLSEDQTFGTSALSTSSRYWNYRIEMFTDGVDGGNLATSSNSTKQAIARISGYGKNVYTSPSYLVYMNHLYTWDKLQTMILPSSIRPRTNNAADMGTTSYRWSGIYGVNGNLSGTLSVTGTSTLTGNVTASGNLSVGGNITDSGDLTVNGNTTLGNATTDTVTISGPATIGTTLRVSGNDEYIGTGTGAQCHIQYDNTNKCVKFIFD